VLFRDELHMGLGGHVPGLIPFLLGVVGWAAAIVAIFKFRSFVTLVRSFADLVTLRPGQEFAARTFAVMFTIFGAVWGSGMIALAFRQ
jgi:hypothetical protein